MPERWEGFVEAAPMLADAGQRLFGASGIGFLATVRRSGAPRLHPVVPIFAGAGLYVFISRGSPKWRDLARDGRYALHAALGPEDEEFVITGEAMLVDDAAQWAGVQEAAGHSIHAGDVLFELRVGQGLHTRWKRVGQPDTVPTRMRWSAE